MPESWHLQGAGGILFSEEGVFLRSPDTMGTQKLANPRRDCRDKLFGSCRKAW